MVAIVNLETCFRVDLWMDLSLGFMDTYGFMDLWTPTHCTDYWVSSILSTAEALVRELVEFGAPFQLRAIRDTHPLGIGTPTH